MPDNPDPRKSLLRSLLEAYMVAQGFHPTYKAGAGPHDEHWGHAELGEGRTFIQCVEWQMGRESAAGRS